jgi:hypothetical protein
MGMLSSQQFSMVLFISHALHVSVIRPSQAGKHNAEEPSITTDPHLLHHLSYLPLESLTKVHTKENTLLPNLFGNPYSYCCQIAFSTVPDNHFI